MVIGSRNRKLVGIETSAPGRLAQVVTTGDQAEQTPPEPAAHDPFELFSQWLAAAEISEPADANAMALATAGSDGLPSVRMVLLKDFDASGFVFYTNTDSQKGAELRANMQAAAVLHWKSLERQVRFRGPVDFVSDTDADDYFASRPRNSRIGAWASRQSRPMETRFALEKALAREAARFGSGEIPRPPHWTGYRIHPMSIEFWTGKPFRLHDRLVFTRARPAGDWTVTRLYP
jgi:pyridoxamine 5'-phosphate oxidase